MKSYRDYADVVRRISFLHDKLERVSKPILDELHELYKHFHVVHRRPQPPRPGVVRSHPRQDVLVEFLAAHPEAKYDAIVQAVWPALALNRGDVAALARARSAVRDCRKSGRLSGKPGAWRVLKP